MRKKKSPKPIANKCNIKELNKKKKKIRNQNVKCFREKKKHDSVNNISPRMLD
jgi:hypothetical protein